MTTDPLPKEGGDLYSKVAHAAEGYPLDMVLGAAATLIASCIRQAYGLRSQAEGRINEIFNKTKTLMLEHYDPTTGKRRSVVPFNQTISPGLVRGRNRVNGYDAGP